MFSRGLLYYNNLSLSQASEPMLAQLSNESSIFISFSTYDMVRVLKFCGALVFIKKYDCDALHACCWGYSWVQIPNRYEGFNGSINADNILDSYSHLSSNACASYSHGPWSMRLLSYWTGRSVSIVTILWPILDLGWFYIGLNRIWLDYSQIAKSLQVVAYMQSSLEA